MRREERELSTQRIWAQGPHQSKRTDAERRERVVDPDDLGPRSEVSVSTGSDKKENVQPVSLHLLYSQSSHVRSRSLHFVSERSLKLTLRSLGLLQLLSSCMKAWFANHEMLIS